MPDKPSTQMTDVTNAFFDAAEAAGFAVERGALQIMLWHGGDKVGGWNTKDAHWYVSKVIARGRDDLMVRHGLRWMTNSHGHCWWQLDGTDRAGAFQAVVEALTGARL